MYLFFISFFISFFVILLIIRYQHIHEHVSGDHDFKGPQKFHQKSVPRIGGLGIFVGLLITPVITYKWNPFLGAFLISILISALPVSGAGLMEDLTKRISVKMRLIAGIISGALLLYLFTITSIRIGIWGLDVLFLNTWLTVIFLSVACSGLANAYNMIDGFNGLASMVGIISTLAISIVAFTVGDLLIAHISLILIGSILGFFIWNYPKGLIFLGDGGAYLIGFMIAALSILLVNRNPLVSPWFALLVNAYPTLETLFTIWRRWIYQGKSPGLPDRIHFHSLIYRRILSWSRNEDRQVSIPKLSHYYIDNAKTSPYLWIISSIGTIPALLFWGDTLLLVICSILFVIIYIYCYRTILKNRNPWWLVTNSRNR